MPVKRPILKDIAREAKVSIAAVSLALRNSPEISPERRAQIIRIAAKLGYAPDPGLGALAEYRRTKRGSSHYRQTLAFLYQPLDGETLSEWVKWPLRRKLLYGADERARELGYRMEVHAIGMTPSTKRAVAAVLAARGIRGVLMHAVRQHPEETAQAFGSFALLNLLQYSEKPSFHSIRSNDYEGMRLALESLAKRGCRRFLYITPEPAFGLFGPEKLGAFEWFLRDVLGVSGHWVHAAEFRTSASDLLGEKRKPDAVLFHDHLEFERVLVAHGIRLPAACRPCLLFASGEVPRYEGIDIMPSEIGRKAVDLMDMMIRHNEVGPPALPTTLLTQPAWLPASDAQPAPSASRSVPAILVS